MNAGDRSSFYFRYDIAAASISSITLAFVAGLIFSDKRLQMHPNRLIGAICLLDSLAFSTFVMRYYCCGFQLYGPAIWVFAHTVQLPYEWISCFGIDGGHEGCWAEKKSYLEY